jgi:DNA polymerase-3 subunit epsilon/oligoribonuclease
MLAIFLDMETTGLDQSRHHAIDIALIIVDVTTGEELGSYSSIIKQPIEVWECNDPISIEINGYTFSEVTSGKDKQLIGDEIISLFQSLGIERGSSVFICQNPGFDRGFFSQLVDVYKQERLNWPYHWLDLASMYWANIIKECKIEKKMFPIKLNLSKNAIAEDMGLVPEASPHKAMNGVKHLIECYNAVLNKP